MTDESQFKEVNGDEHEPATKGDVAELARMTGEEFARMQGEYATKDEMQEFRSEVREKFTEGEPQALNIVVVLVGVLWDLVHLAAPALPIRFSK